jgi:hypothetical protein
MPLVASQMASDFQDEMSGNSLSVCASVECSEILTPFHALLWCRFLWTHWNQDAKRSQDIECHRSWINHCFKLASVNRLNHLGGKFSICSNRIFRLRGSSGHHGLLSSEPSGRAARHFTNV